MISKLPRLIYKASMHNLIIFMQLWRMYLPLDNILALFVFRKFHECSGNAFVTKIPQLPLCYRLYILDKTQHHVCISLYKLYYNAYHTYIHIMFIFLEWSWLCGTTTTEWQNYTRKLPPSDKMEHQCLLYPLILHYSRISLGIVKYDEFPQIIFLTCRTDI